MTVKKKSYTSYHWSDEHTHTPSITKDLIKIFQLYNFQKFNHLDVGCGNGYITKVISKFFKKTIGIDLSKDGIKFAKKNFYNKKKISFLNTSSDNLIKKKLKFDVITTIEVIEHQYDPFIFLSNLEKLCKKGGYVIITTPYHGYFKNLALSIIGAMDNHFTALWQHGHIKFFSIKTLKKLISNYKFDIVSIKYSGRFYPISSSMIFVLKKK